MPHRYNPFTKKLEWGWNKSEIEEIAEAIATERVKYAEVNTFADLPMATENTGKICVVKNATGILLINKKQRGLYRSDGLAWQRLGA